MFSSIQELLPAYSLHDKTDSLSQSIFSQAKQAASAFYNTARNYFDLDIYNKPLEKTPDSTSLSTVQKIFAAMNKGLGYIKTHPAQVFTLFTLGGAALRYGYESRAYVPVYVSNSSDFNSQYYSWWDRNCQFVDTDVIVLGSVYFAAAQYSELIRFTPHLSLPILASASLIYFSGRVESASVVGQFPATIQLSSLNGNNGFVLNGRAAEEASGLSVSQAGDINNDGIGDVIIGAPSAYSNAGKCYVVFGSLSWTSPFSLDKLDGTNGFELNGVTGIDTTGYSISHGDINHDGIQDIIIGSPNAISYNGKTYVVFGKNNWTSPVMLSNLNGNNGFEIIGTLGYDQTGFSVSGVGDVNKDSIDDIIIGSPQQYGAGPNDTGKAYVVFGKSNWTTPLTLTSLSGTNGFQLNGATRGDFAGWSVNRAGDVNNDGIQDMIIGAYNASSRAGKVYVVFGKMRWTSPFSLSTLNGVDGFELNGEAVNDSSGWAVNQAGDVNNDGIQDIIIGAVQPFDTLKIGKAYVVFGKSNWTSPISLSTLNGLNGFRLDGEIAGGLVGGSVSQAGDVNNDGIGDIIIGANGATPNPGNAYVVFGKSNWTSPISLSTLNGLNGFRLDGEAAGDLVGGAVSQAGDINKDGIEDIIVGAWNATNAAGKTYVVFGDSPPVLVNNRLTVRQGAGVALDANSLSAYDLNHANDSLVFIPTNVIAGHFGIDYNPAAALTNFTQAQITNGMIRFLHDGTATMPSYAITVKSSGFAFVGPVSANITFSLSTAPTSTPTQPPTQNANGRFPASILLSSLNGANGVVFNGEAVGDVSGISVDGAGDVNNDGIQDIIIGAFGASSRMGKTYVIFGKKNWVSPISLSSINGTNGFVLNGVLMSEQSGIAVSSAGDINNDKIGDIIIGAVNKAYFVFGKSNWTSPLSLSTLNGANGFLLDGGPAGGNLGFSVDHAGDINDDGISDVILGAYSTPINSTLFVGRSYVIFGKAKWTSPLSPATFFNGINGFTLDGIAYNDNTGLAVSQAGDINNDGMQDMIIGAFKASLEKGKSYVVFGKRNWDSSMSLAALNGTNGFVLEGMTAGEQSGVSVSQAGDVNNDGTPDMIIGAYNASTTVGKAYVVFGKRNWTSTISLSTLNGANGFTLEGVAVGDECGLSVSQAGDFNNDGIDDIIIAAPQNTIGGFGKAYVVFGKSNWTSSLSLSTLNGVNGFVLQGEVVGDISGLPVNQAGDVNNDGVDDIVIAASQSGLSGAGKVYLVFGDSPPVLVNNRLTIMQGATVPLNASSLSAYDLNHVNGSLVFVLSNVIAGRFEMTSNVGAPLANFTQTQISNGMIQFVHDGSSVAPKFDTKVITTGFAFVGPVSANINFSPLSKQTSTPAQTSSIGSTILSTSEESTESTIMNATMPTGKTEVTNPNSSTPAIIGGVIGGVVVLGVGLAACGIWRKKRNAASSGNRAENKKVESNNNGEVDLKASGDLTEKYETPKPPVQSDTRASRASSNYGRIDAFKEREEQYQTAPSFGFEDLKMTH